MSKRSAQMDQLYGETIAQEVYERLQDLDPELNELIQQIAYDVFWARKGLSTTQKSLVTVLTLFALQKEEQTRIHLKGFFNSNGQPSDILHHLSQIEDLIGPEGASRARSAILEVAQGRGLKLVTQKTSPQAENEFSRVVVLAAKGDLSNLRSAIEKYLENGGDLETIRSSFIHMIVYAGFPSTMNAFVALKELRDSANR